jgi:putative beta-lysine N-acetyltransferase
MIDRIETFGESIFQHGRHNKRIYLMKLHPGDQSRIIPHLDHLALTRGYSKIFAKVPLSAESLFIENGYAVEASIPGFYVGKEAALFMGKYFSRERKEEGKPDLVREVLQTARDKGEHAEIPEKNDGMVCRKAGEEDTEEMAGLYRLVFATYPFPIHDPDYLKTTMAKNVAYFGIWQEGRLLALSSAEIDCHGKNAEMTDFATRAECRGKGLARFLLGTMEKTMRTAGIITSYTIARAYSFGMNITFAEREYKFDGTLTNNTNISGSLESMNVWHKKLGQGETKPFRSRS